MTVMKNIIAKLQPFFNKIKPLLIRYKQLLIAGGLVILAGILFMAIQVILGPEEPVTTYTLPYTQNFDDVNLRRWYTNGGVWTLRTQTLAQTIGGEEGIAMIVERV